VKRFRRISVLRHVRHAPMLPRGIWAR
jgi:hypothetical protein